MTDDGFDIDPEIQILTRHQAIPQPQPSIQPGGDCGACCLAGYLHTDLEGVYRKVRQTLEGPINSAIFNQGLYLQHRFGVLEFLDRVTIDTLVPRSANVRRHIPLWLTEFNESQIHRGMTGTLQADGWYDYLSVLLEANYRVLTQISFDARPAARPEQGTNHWVVLNGVRTYFEPMENGASRGHEEVRVSCSVRGEYWIDRLDFLHNHGGFALLPIR